MKGCDWRKLIKLQSLKEQVKPGDKRKPPSVDDLKTHCFNGENSFNILVAEWNDTDSSKKDFYNTPLVGYLFYHYHFSVFDSKSLRITDVYLAPVTEHKENILKDLFGHLVKLAVQEECSHIRWTAGNNNYLEKIGQYSEASNLTKEEGWFFFQLEKSQLNAINKAC